MTLIKKLHTAKPLYGVASDHRYNSRKLPTSYKDALIYRVHFICKIYP